MISMFRTGDIHIVSGFLYDNVEWELKKKKDMGVPKSIPYGTKCPSSEGACVSACPWVYLLNTFKRFHATQVGGNFPFPQLGMEFNDNITSNN